MVHLRPLQTYCEQVAKRNTIGDYTWTHGSCELSTALTLADSIPSFFWAFSEGCVDMRGPISKKRQSLITAIQSLLASGPNMQFYRKHKKDTWRTGAGLPLGPQEFRQYDLIQQDYRSKELKLAVEICVLAEDDPKNSIEALEKVVKLKRARAALYVRFACDAEKSFRLTVYGLCDGEPMLCATVNNWHNEEIFRLAGLDLNLSELYYIIHEFAKDN